MVESVAMGFASHQRNVKSVKEKIAAFNIGGLIGFVAMDFVRMRWIVKVDVWTMGIVHFPLLYVAMEFALFQISFQSMNVHARKIQTVEKATFVVMDNVRNQMIVYVKRIMIVHLKYPVLSQVHAPRG